MKVTNGPEVKPLNLCFLRLVFVLLFHFSLKIPFSLLLFVGESGDGRRGEGGDPPHPCGSKNRLSTIK